MPVRSFVKVRNYNIGVFFRFEEDRLILTEKMAETHWLKCFHNLYLTQKSFSVEVL